jgi:hypothetical protein
LVLRVKSSKCFRCLHGMRDYSREILWCFNVISKVFPCLKADDCDLSCVGHSTQRVRHRIVKLATLSGAFVSSMVRKMNWVAEKEHSTLKRVILEELILKQKTPQVQYRRHKTPSWSNRIQPSHSHHIYFTFVFTLFSSPRHDLPTNSFLFRFSD